MFELAAYTARKRVKGALALSIGLSAFSALYAGLFPSITEGIDLDAYMQTLPKAFLEAFGVRSLNTIEGYMATELYQFAWVILLGIYIAYSAASLISKDVEDDRMDITLALPISRARVVREKFLAIVPGLLVINLVVGVVTWAGTRVVGYPIDTANLLAVHVLSLPYLFACGAIGLAFGVVFDRASYAQRAAMATVFGLFLLESIITGTDYEAAGAIAPGRYYDPTAILVDGTYDLVGAAFLLAATVVLVGASQWYFTRKDIN